MKPRPRTAFDDYVGRQMKKPAFAREYQRARSEIDAIDTLVRALDARREAAGLSKSALARRVGLTPEFVRRLFTAEAPNPTLDTFLRLADGLGCTLDLAPNSGRRLRKVAARERRG